jgi:hypothetical protein
MGEYESDGLTESSFDRSDAARYKIIFDTNSSILDATMLDNIEDYVRNGGVFVTYAQTGRHSPTDIDSWPIERLTGFHVSAIDPLDASGKPLRQQGLQPVPGQDIFSGDWKQVKANGLTLEPVADDAIPLMLWEDGSVAIGMRPLGAGYIVQIGCKFTGKGIPDRVLPGGLANPPIHSADHSESGALSRLLKQILVWRDIEPVSAQFMPRNSPVILRHFIANTGLYNVWALWNRSETETVQGEIDLSASVAASWAWDPLANDSFVFGEDALPVTLEPLQTRAFLSPINQISAAPLAWFNLQRQWWRQGKTPPASDLPAIPHQNSIDLNADWAFLPLDEGQDGALFAALNVNDDEWERVDMGIWSLPDRRDVKRAILRKQFTLPMDWNHEIRLSIQSWLGQTFVDEGRIWLDGRLIRDWSPDGISNLNTDGVLQAGATHTLAVEIRSSSSLAGARGNAWLWHWPAPESSLDLSGEWIGSQNALYSVTQAVTFPGQYNDMIFKREVLIPEDQAESAVTIKLDVTGGMTGVLVNGVWVRRLHHHIGTEFDLNITPWIQFGQSNTIELVCMNGPTTGTVRSVVLNFYSPEKYP